MSEQIANSKLQIAESQPEILTTIPPSAIRHRLSAISGRVDAYAVLLAVISLLVLGPMLQPGYFWGAHDARHSVYFLFEFDRVFQDGIWYPRWFPDMTYGYGYPLFNIYGPLAFDAGELFHLLGADWVTAVKIVFALAWILSGLAMYGFVKRVFSRESITPKENEGSSDKARYELTRARAAAFIAGLAYVFMPYHLIDVYVRAALAESVALVFLPLTLWAFYETVLFPRPRAILFAAFAYAGMLFAHNGIALLFSPVLGAWILFLLFKRLRETGAWNSRTPILTNLLTFIRLGLPALTGLILGLGVTGIFLLPLVAEYRYINVAQWTANYYNYQEHFVEFFQLFSPTWGFGISTPGPHDGLSFQFGAVPLLLAFFSLFVIIKNPNGARPYLLFFLVLTIIVALLMFSFSLPVWQLAGLASVAQFPWRLLTLTTLSLSILAGAVLLDAPGGVEITQSEVESKFSLPVVALSALLLIGSYPYITSQNLVQAKEGPVGLKGLMRFESSANEMTGSTVYADQQPLWSPLADNVMADKKINSKVDFSAKPDSLFIGLTKYGLHTDGEEIGYNAQEDNTPIIFNVQNYPGWRAYLLTKGGGEVVRELPIQIEPPYGRIKVLVPKGEYWLLLRFEDTAPRVIGEIVSGVSLLIAFGLFTWDMRRKRKDSVDSPATATGLLDSNERQ